MKMLYEQVKNGLRNLFNIRQKRRSPPVGSRPAINSSICRGVVKMQVTHEINSSLWQWLAMQGWRKITVPNDRRRYRNMPKGALKILIKTSPEALDSIHGRMLAAVAKAKAPGKKSSLPARPSRPAMGDAKFENQAQGPLVSRPSVAD